MHHGILRVGLIALSVTLAPDVSAQTRGAQTGIAGRQTTTATSARAAAVARLSNVVGLTADSAMKLLASTGLPVVRRDTSTNAAPRDQVISQQPAAGTPLSAIRDVTVIVAIPTRAAGLRGALVAAVTNGVIIPPTSVSTVPPAGPPPSTVVPLLVGRNAQSTLALIAKSRLHLEQPVVTEFSDVADSGFVFQQHPLPRTRVDTGSLVRIWISLGPHRAPPTLATPDVLGKTLAAADQTLRNARLVVGHVDTTFRSGGRGLIEHQLPAPGSQTHPGDAVALRIAMAPPLISVPSVIGLQRGAAQRTLRAAGLALGQVTPVRMSGRGTVIVGQIPAAQTDVVRGTFVDVEENQPLVQRRTVIPKLDGLTSAVATQRLVSDSLSLGSVVVSDNGDAPVVVAQRPAAGDSAFFHDPVSITLASPRVDLPPPTIADAPPTAPPTPPVTNSRTPTIPLVVVPPVTNMSFEGARRLIDSLGLITVSTAANAGKNFVVRAQRPDPGSLVPFGAQVTLALEPTDVRSVPHLVGLKRAAAADHALADGFTMSIHNRRRVLLQLFERVVMQEPDTQTIGRGDQAIQVELATPLVPPLPAGIALVLAAAGTALKARTRRPQQGKVRPLGDLHISLDLTTATPPVPSPIPDDRVIRTAITFALDTGRGEWTIESKDKSLVSHIRTHV